MQGEKTPEEKLVDELVGEGFFYNQFNELANDQGAKRELYNIVTKAWKNGASVSEIQQVYDENLLTLKSPLGISKKSRSKLLLEIFSALIAIFIIIVLSGIYKFDIWNLVFISFVIAFGVFSLVDGIINGILSHQKYIRDVDSTSTTELNKDEMRLYVILLGSVFTCLGLLFLLDSIGIIVLP